MAASYQEFQCKRRIGGNNDDDDDDDDDNIDNDERMMRMTLWRSNIPTAWIEQRGR